MAAHPASTPKRLMPVSLAPNAPAPPLAPDSPAEPEPSEVDNANPENDPGNRPTQLSSNLPDPGISPDPVAAVAEAEQVEPDAPHVAEIPEAPRQVAANVVQFRISATRGGNSNPLESTRATRGRKAATRGKWRVDAVKASKGTWAFRLRWVEGGARSAPVYVRRVTDPVYQKIREGNYESFKQQLISNHERQSALHASQHAG